MVLQSLFPVKSGIFYDLPDFLQRQAQLPVEQNLLQQIHLHLPVDAVAVWIYPFGPE